MTDDQADALLAALSREGFTMPYLAQPTDYVSAESIGTVRATQLAQLRAADEKADVENRQALRAALAAAPLVRLGTGEPLPTDRGA